MKFISSFLSLVMFLSLPGISAAAEDLTLINSSTSDSGQLVQLFIKNSKIELPLEDEKVENIKIDGDKLIVGFSSGGFASATKPNSDNIIEIVYTGQDGTSVDAVCVVPAQGESLTVDNCRISGELENEGSGSIQKRNPLIVMGVLLTFVFIVWFSAFF